jgi:hypothetical protein
MDIDINIETQVSQTITDGVTDKAPSENAVFDALANKVDKETGKGLSEEDFTMAEKNKLAGIEAGAQVNVNADWNATSGDAEILNKPTIPDAALLVPYAGAVADVDLGTHKLSAKDLVVNHSSGSGDAATITKGGNGEALKVVKSSGSGNAASITGGVTLLEELKLTTKLADAEIASAATWNAKIGGAVSIGQVAFGTASGVIGGDAGLTWDNVNKRLGVGGTPLSTFYISRLSGSASIAHPVDNAISIRRSDSPVVFGMGWLSNNTFYLQGKHATNGASPFSISLNPSGGNVGIGTDAPLTSLHLIRPESQVRFESNGSNSSIINLKSSNGEVFIGLHTFGHFGISSTSNLGSSFFYVQPSLSRTGIGTTSPTQTLDVNGTGRIRNGVSLADTSGNVRIGTTTDAGFRLDVNGTARFGATTVRAPGALSTDIAFRVQNSADTANLFQVKGNGTLNAANLPTSATGLVAGDIWNDAGTLKIV